MIRDRTAQHANARNAMRGQYQAPEVTARTFRLLAVLVVLMMVAAFAHAAPAQTAPITDALAVCPGLSQSGCERAVTLWRAHGVGPQQCQAIVSVWSDPVAAVSVVTCMHTWSAEGEIPTLWQAHTVFTWTGADVWPVAFMQAAEEIRI